jgi:hypothetical protein
MAQGVMRPEHRPLKQLSSRIEKALVAYVAAGAAAALVATSEPAEAKIVHTNTNVRVGFRPVEIDLNHDGVPDFVITFCPFYHSDRLIVGPRVAGNAIQEAPGSNDAAPGFRGTPTGPANSFRASGASCFSTNGTQPVGIAMATYFRYLSYFPEGPWIDTTNRYLGLKFIINGQTHFGWARLSITDLTGRLTGYAYETAPNTQIIEGATSDVAAFHAPDRVDRPLPPSSPTLGMLARGFQGIPMWRRDYTPVAIRRDDPIAG